MIAMFALLEDTITQLPWLTLINYWLGSGNIWILGHGIPIQLFAAGALIPIQMYSGEKLTHSRWVQWTFYLFYPVHLAVLVLIRQLLR